MAARWERGANGGTYMDLGHGLTLNIHRTTPKEGRADYVVSIFGRPMKQRAPTLEVAQGWAELYAQRWLAKALDELQETEQQQRRG